MGKGLAAEIVHALSEQAEIVPGTHATTTVMPRSAQQLAALRQQRDEVAADLERLVLAHPLWPVLTSMPGVDVRTAARLLIEIAHKAFASVAHLAAYAGLAPVTRRTGSPIRGEHPSRRGNKVLKRALLLSAWPSETQPHGPITRAQDPAEQAPQPGPHRTGTVTLRRSPCCVTAPSTNPSQPLTLDETHRGPPGHFPHTRTQENSGHLAPSRH